MTKLTVTDTVRIANDNMIAEGRITAVHDNGLLDVDLITEPMPPEGSPLPEQKAAKAEANERPERGGKRMTAKQRKAQEKKEREAAERQAAIDAGEEPPPPPEEETFGSLTDVEHVSSENVAKADAGVTVAVWYCRDRTEKLNNPPADPEVVEIVPG